MSTSTPHAAALAQRIVDAGTRAGWPDGHHLTELKLADALGVSRTPVRAALKVLEGHGIVENRPNRGFFLLRDAALLPELHLSPPPARNDELYRRILRDRVSGTLAAEVTLAKLSKRYGVGTTALSRLLVRMQGEGLVTRGAATAWVFSPSLRGGEAIFASYVYRRMVEPEAMLLESFEVKTEAAELVRRRHLDLLARIDAAPRRRGIVAPVIVYTLDSDFHEMLARFSGNAFVLSAVRQQNALRRLLEYASYSDVARVKVWCQEHLGVLEALLAHKVGDASAALRAHLDNALQAAVRSGITRAGGARHQRP